MRTQGMPHQLEALRRANGKDSFAFLLEQGCGKSWIAMADSERMYASGKIDGVLIIPPNCGRTNWAKREIPTHFDAPCIVREWRSGAGIKEIKHTEELLKPRNDGEQLPLRILVMGIDAVNTKSGLDFALKFLNATKSLIIIDESTRIKNPKSKRTINVMLLRRRAVAARILTGTPITNAPADIFSQFEFLESGLLGTTSYRSFVAEYSDLLDMNEAMQKKNRLADAKKELNHLENCCLGDGPSMDQLDAANRHIDMIKAAITKDDHLAIAMTRNNPRAAFAQIVKTNPDGTKRYRNLEKLQSLIAPHSYRILKKDCLDLPEKIYQQVFFDLDKKQRVAYDFLEKELRIAILDGEVLSVKNIAKIVKLQQITSGFLNLPDGLGMQYIGDKNPRLDALLDIVEDTPGKIIVWARFKEELRAIAEALRNAGRNVVEYHGGTSEKDRDFAIESLQNGVTDVFVGQPQSAGIALTLTAAETSIYYSNDFNNETRKQSEDRNHRIGTKNNVNYIDLMANNTIDESITRALQTKSDLAKIILGDFR